MAFEDFKDLYEPLVLPIGGKEYTIPPVTFADGVILSDVFDDGAKHKLSNKKMFRMLLGDTLDAMIADGVAAPAINRAAYAAMADFHSGRSVAEIMWKTGGDPKAVTSYVEAQQNRAQRRSKNSAAASSTPRRASTSTTRKSRKS